MRRDEPDIPDLFRPRTVAVKERLKTEEIPEGDPTPPSRQQETTAFGRGGMSHRAAGMSSRMDVGKEARGSARGAP
jgi:hypothetical protein